MYLARKNRIGVRKFFAVAKIVKKMLPGIADTEIFPTNRNLHLSHNCFEMTIY